jgi:hypothetical protein
VENLLVVSRPKDVKMIEKLFGKQNAVVIVDYRHTK